MRGRPAKKIINNKLRCANCYRFLDVSFFTKCPRYKSGYRSYCKECERFRKNKINGKELKIIGKWLMGKERKCEYCGIKEKDIGKINDGHIFWGRYFYLTIDRKDNSKGYEINNICLACMRCNRIKSNIFTYEEMKIIGEMLKRKSQNLLLAQNIF